VEADVAARLNNCTYAWNLKSLSVSTLERISRIAEGVGLMFVVMINTSVPVSCTFFLVFAVTISKDCRQACLPSLSIGCLRLA